MVGALKGEQFWLRSVATHPKNIYDQRDDWVFWQYTAEGRVDGIKGNVDRNAFHGTRRQWQRWLEGHRTR
jgi:lysozyme